MESGSAKVTYHIGRLKLDGGGQIRQADEEWVRHVQGDQGRTGMAYFQNDMPRQSWH